jgi:transcriptional regulator with XRE-family HTH domain
MAHPILSRMDDDARAQLRAEIKARGLTQSELAAELGMSRVHLNRLLSGERGQIPADLQRLIERLGFRVVLERTNDSGD